MSIFPIMFCLFHLKWCNVSNILIVFFYFVDIKYFTESHGVGSPLDHFFALKKKIIVSEFPFSISCILLWWFYLMILLLCFADVQHPSIFMEMEWMEWGCNQDAQQEGGSLDDIIHMFVYHMRAFSVYFSTKESYTVYAWFDYKCLDIFIFWLMGAYFITFFADVLAFGVAFFCYKDLSC